MISAQSVTSSGVNITQVQSDQHLYFSESRPSEKGRTTLIRYSEKGCEEILSQDYSIGSRIHVYGGRSFEVAKGRIFFINSDDQAIYELKEGCEKVYGEDGAKFGDLRFDGRHLYALCEKGDDNQIVKIDTKEKSLETIASGSHFYASLTLSPNGKELAWVEWDHPHMPWDESRINSTKGSICATDQTSATDPLYLRDGSLMIQWDATGYWNPYFASDLSHPIIEQPADFASPLWQFGSHQYCEVGNHIAFLSTDHGLDYITLYDKEEMTYERLELPFNVITHLAPFDNQLALVAGSATQFLTLVLLNPLTGEYKEIKQTQSIDLDPQTFAIAEPITLLNRYKQEVHSFFYPPNPPVENPPLIVKCHSGPTSRVTPLLNLAIQYYTSRGFAFLETNYGGSTGYGRAYRNRLLGQWGEVDVTDTLDVVTHLINDEVVDPDNIFITGSSSGGLTALLALAHSDLFKASTLLYAVTDLIALCEHTHKFEKHYLDSLIGPYPQVKKLYHSRNPIAHLDKISTPTLIFQGLKDKVVDPSQATQLDEKLGHLSTLHTYAEEGHSFKRSETKKEVLENSLKFYNQCLNRS